MCPLVDRGFEDGGGPLRVPPSLVCSSSAVAGSVGWEKWCVVLAGVVVVGGPRVVGFCWLLADPAEGGGVGVPLLA